MTQAASRIFANASSSNSLSFIFQAVLAFASCNSLSFFQAVSSLHLLHFKLIRLIFAIPSVTPTLYKRNGHQTSAATTVDVSSKWGIYLVTAWHIKSKQHLETFVSINSHHYSKVITRAIASQIAGVSIVYSTVCSSTDQIKHQSSAPRAFLGGIHWWHFSRNRQYDGILSICYLNLSVTDQSTPSKFSG